MFGKYGNLCTNENAWLKNKHGDLAAYSVFLKKYLFIGVDPDQVLVVPDFKKTKVSFACKFWVPIPALYLFPTKIEVSDGYNFEITTKEADKLKAMEMRALSYRSYRYYLLSDSNTNDYSKWAIYIHKTEKTVDIFTLPFDYIKRIEKL